MRWKACLRKLKKNNYYLFGIDDCYKVLLHDYFSSSSTPRSWDIFPVTYPIANSLRLNLFRAYNKYISEKNNKRKRRKRKKRKLKKDLGNCSFKELLDML